MIYLTDYGLELANKSSESCIKEISPISRGEFANEYADRIDFFDKNKISLSNRLIPPYITTETHGKDVFKDLYKLVEDLKSKSVLDLGCGAGEFLNGLPIENKYGCTIHLGERDYAKDIYGLKYVLPLDMREIELAFKQNSLDLIIAHCCLHFLVKEDRFKVLKSALNLLNVGGYFAVIDLIEIPE